MLQRGSRRKWLRYEVARRTARGDSQRSIATALESDRKTVRKLQQELLAQRNRDPREPPAELLREQAARPSKLDRHLEVIKSLLKLYPKLRATRAGPIPTSWHCRNQPWLPVMERRSRADWLSATGPDSYCPESADVLEHDSSKPAVTYARAGGASTCTLGSASRHQTDTAWSIFAATLPGLH